jgi:hypothetical protein
VAALDDPRVRILQEFINARLPHGPEDVTLAKVLISTDPSAPRAIAVPLLKYCPNVEREHNGQDVYYNFNGKTITPRCWSEKDGTDRKHGPCTSPAAIEFFRSLQVTVPQDKIRAMFPGALTSQPSNLDQQIYNNAQLPRNSAGLLARATVPGNRSARATPEMIALYNRAITLRREINAHLGGDAGGVSYGQPDQEPQQEVPELPPPPAVDDEPLFASVQINL